ncbi:hypothetical protein ANANG_G00209330 [Anguilla anguilla]|uniref:Uncharacterized protein n=1 Tax=Anguilla anguilla TaxID=7936 RepID=A0A9D3M0R9_ANGAN|nr:hypothetical protein ANANG_G00209330 [Anguilla anguilla]
MNSVPVFYRASRIQWFCDDLSIFEPESMVPVTAALLVRLPGQSRFEYLQFQWGSSWVHELKTRRMSGKHFNDLHGAEKRDLTRTYWQFSSSSYSFCVLSLCRYWYLFVHNHFK